MAVLHHPERRQSERSPRHPLATTLQAQGDLDGARKLHEKTLEVRRRVLGVDHPDTLTNMTNLAATLQAQGDLDGARELQEKELAICRRVVGERHPDTTSSQWNLLRTLIAQKNTNAADSFRAGLSWLRTANPARLSAGQRQIRTNLGFDDD